MEPDSGGGLTLAGRQVPSEQLYHSPSSDGQGREKIMKGSWVETQTGRDHSSITVTGKKLNLRKN